MTNSFWREVLDHLPGVILLFRVDENEDAHLIFVNSEIQNILGYTPEEFVLGSETPDSRIKSGVNELVEKIAELSHNSETDTKPICRFFSKRATDHSFSFKFQIFSVTSSPLPFISVSLKPLRNENREVGELVKTEKISSGPVFAMESPLMKALMKKVDGLIDQQRHLLFRGDRGTGKKTLARQVFQAEKFAGAGCLEWDLKSMTLPEQNRAVEELCEERDDEVHKTGDRCSILLIEISKLTVSNQSKLLGWLKKREDSGGRTRILATSRVSLEELVNRGRFSTELYYFLSFDTVLLPPLSKRKEDILLLVNTWLPDAAEVLGLGKPEIPEEVMDRLMHHEWPGNFYDFFEVMRNSLPGSDKGIFRLSMDSKRTAELKIDSNEIDDSGNDEIILFDEMNRRYLEKVLMKTGGKIYGKNGAAHFLGMKPTTLQSKLKKLGIR